MGMIVSMFFFIMIREGNSYQAFARNTLIMIRVKIESPQSYDFTEAELYAYNFIEFRVISNSASHYYLDNRKQ